MAAALQYQVDERSFPLEGKQGEHRLSQSKLHKKSNKLLKKAVAKTMTKKSPNLESLG